MQKGWWSGSRYRPNTGKKKKKGWGGEGEGRKDKKGERKPKGADDVLESNDVKELGQWEGRKKQIHLKLS
jgi:hypothetical protein